MQTEASLFVTAEAAEIISRLRAFLHLRDIECYVVGGYLRDGLLGRPSCDIDLTVSGDSVSIARELAYAFGASFVLLDEIHQVARVVYTHNEKRWHLDIAAMRGSIEDDLSKRDFTIDAIAAEPDIIKAGWHQIRLIDPLDGIRDLERGVIKAVSDVAFAEDPGRLLRAFRLAAELDFSIDGETEVLIQRDGELIANVSGERVRDELGRIFETSVTTASLRHLDRIGILDALIPELAVSKGVEQPKEHFWDVFEHSIETVAAVEALLEALGKGGDLLDSLAFSVNLSARFSEEIAIGRTRGALIKMAALLHDIAKPQTRQTHQNGKTRFLGHDQQGARIATAIMERLRFSTREKRMVTRMIEYHMRPAHLSNLTELPTRRAIYRYFRDTADVGIDTLFLSLADHMAARGPLLDMAEWQGHVEMTRYMLDKWFQEETVVSPPKLINGHDLIHEFELTPGPRIGELLEAVREAQASGEIETRQDALDFVRKELIEDYAPQR